MPYYQFVIQRADGSNAIKPCAATDLEEACTQALVMADDLAMALVADDQSQPIGLDLCDGEGALIIGIGIVPGTPLSGAAARLAKRVG